MFLDHTRRSTVGRTPTDELISSSQRPLSDNKQHPQETDIHAPYTGGIRTRDPTKRAGSDTRLGPRHYREMYGFSFPLNSLQVILFIYRGFQEMWW
jgi:hypothetical protein